MPIMPRTHRVLGQPTATDRARERIERVGTAHEQGYTFAWHKARTAYLAAHPLCAMCARRGRAVPANVVDHIIPHRGDRDLFWNEDNWQSLCAPCHNGPKRREELATRRLATRAIATTRSRSPQG